MIPQWMTHEGARKEDGSDDLFETELGQFSLTAHQNPAHAR